MVMVKREKSNYLIQSVSHALDVIEQFRGDVEELGVTELSKRLKLHKNNVFRILATLESCGYIEQNKATENYRLGLKCLQLGQTYVHQMGFLRQAKPVLQQLVHECQESAYVAVQRNNGVVPIEFVETERPIRIISFVGQHLPLHCTAPGKVHLAFTPDEQIKAFLPNGLKKFTPKTISDQNTLLQHLKEVTSHGYAIEDCEYVEDMKSISVPIRDYTRNVVGSVTVAGPAYRLTPERIEKEIIPSVLRRGKELSSRLGFHEGL
jgi:DNA-binding IclR family transcriptional regulator